MDNCSCVYEKVIFFNEVNENERQKIKNHADNCSSCHKVLQQVGIIMTSLDRDINQHSVDDELLLRYSIYLSAPKEADYDGRKLTQSEIANIRDHIAGCGACRNNVEQYCQDFQEIEEYWEREKLPSLMLNPKLLFETLNQRMAGFLKKVANYNPFIFKPRFFPIALGTSVLVILLWVGPFFRGDQILYNQLTSLDEVSLLTRSSLPDPLSEALSAFHESNYNQSIQDLEISISSNTSDPSLFYAHYVLGICYLYEAQSDFLGRFRIFNAMLINKGIQNFERASVLSGNPGIEEDCLWYIAKAFIMKKEEEKAIQTFESIIRFEGRRFKEAKEALNNIASLMNIR